MVDFGDLQRVDIGEVWPDEDSFSIWLSKNIKKLDDEVIFKIDHESVEREVFAWNGTLRVDLRCDATFPGSDELLPVVIENQVYPTDSSHLSGLIQYAVAFEAGGAVWIASEASAGYIRVVEWLNEHPGITAYLFTIEVFRVDDSKPVVRLVRRAGPDPALAHEGGGRSTNPEESRRRREWWKRVRAALARECAEEFGIWEDNGRAWAGYYRTEYPKEDTPIESLAGTPIGFYVQVMKNESDVGIWFPRGDQAGYYFDRLEKMKGEFEQNFGQPLKWEQYRGYRYIYWDDYDSYGYAGDPEKHDQEAETIADGMKRLITAVNAAMSSIEPYEES